MEDLNNFLGKSTTLNDLLKYGMETHRNVSLHVRKLPQASTEEKWELLVSGLKKLAGKIETESRFNAVTDITAYSWIIAGYGPLLKKLGFHLDPEKQHPLHEILEKRYKRKQHLHLPWDRAHTKKSAAFAYMPRGEFLAKYGKNVVRP